MREAGRGGIDWDDIRYVLTVARGGSVRAAASGYRMTGAGDEVLGFAEQMEASSNLLESRVIGRDQGIHGLLRVTMAPTIATHLLMPDFTAFAQLHPEVEISVLSLDEPVNLTNRETDVAIRVVYDRNTLPRRSPARALTSLWRVAAHPERSRNKLPRSDRR